MISLKLKILSFSRSLNAIISPPVYFVSPKLRGARVHFTRGLTSTITHLGKVWLILEKLLLVGPTSENDE